MTDPRLERLAAELRGWAQRPTALSPAAARTRVLARLSGRSVRPPRRLTAGVWATAALALILAIGTLVLAPLVSGRREPPLAPTPTLSVQTPRQTIVHQLSSGTKLYIVVQPKAADDES